MGKINESIELIKNTLDVKINLATAEEREKLADAKLALADLKSTIADLKDSNQQLQATVKKKGDYILDMGVMWLSNDKQKEQPFCPVCFARNMEMPLQKIWEGSLKNQSPWSCPNKDCTSTFNPWDYKQPSRVSHTTRSSGFGDWTF